MLGVGTSRTGLLSSSTTSTRLLSRPLPTPHPLPLCIARTSFHSLHYPLILPLSVSSPRLCSCRRVELADGDSVGHAVAGVRHGVAVADVVFRDCRSTFRCCVVVCMPQLPLPLSDRVAVATVVFRLQLEGRVVLLPLWYSGCTLREGRHGQVDHFAIAITGLPSTAAVLLSACHDCHCHCHCHCRIALVFLLHWEVLRPGYQLRSCHIYQLNQLVSIRCDHNTRKTFIIPMGRGSLSIGLIVGSV